MDGATTDTSGLGGGRGLTRGGLVNGVAGNACGGEWGGAIWSTEGAGGKELWWEEPWESSLEDGAD